MAAEACKYKRLILTRSRSWHNHLHSIDDETKHVIMHGQDAVRLRHNRQQRYQQHEEFLKRSHSLNCFAAGNSMELVEQAWPRRRSNSKGVQKYATAKHDKRSPIGRLLDYLPAATSSIQSKSPLTRTHAKLKPCLSSPARSSSLSPPLKVTSPKSSPRSSFKFSRRKNSAPSLLGGLFSDGGGGSPKVGFCLF